jgi:hypothetical protein
MKLFRLFLAVVVALSVTSAFARVWTDKFGKTTQGKFVRYFEGDVVLLRGTRVITIPYLDLSEDDREFVRQELEKKDEAGMLPPEPDDEEIILPKPSEERTWTSNDGKKIQARLVAVSERKVTLLVRGKEFTIPMKRLSKPDQQYAGFLKHMPRDVAEASANQLAEGPSPASRQTDPPPSFHGASIPPSDATPSTPEPSSAEPSPAPSPNVAPPIGREVAPASPPRFAPQMVEYKYCKQCGKTVPNNLGAGDKCPHCGVFFSFEEDTSGKIIKRAPVGKYVAYGGGIPGIAILIGLFIRWLKR